MTLAAVTPERDNTPAGPRRRLGTAKEVAGILGMPLTTLYDHARGGGIPGTVRIGTRVRFDLDKLDAWLDAGGDLERTNK